MFDFLNAQKLNPQDFNQNTEFLIEGFLPKGLITMFYADGGMGKSWLAMAVAKKVESLGLEVIFLDFDNPLSVLKDRGVEHKLILPCPQLHYVQRSKSELSAFEMLEALESKATANQFGNTLIIMDSLRDFGDVNNDATAMKIMDRIKNIREAGATIVVLHHSNKDGKNYQGSNNLRNSIDNMYLLTQIDSPQGEIRFLLTVKKERANIVDTAFKVNVGDLSLLATDVQDAKLSSEDKAFITEVKTALTKQPGINKTELLEALGYKKDDKTARDRLDQYDTLYWACTKIKGAYTYRLI